MTSQTSYTIHEISLALRADERMTRRLLNGLGIFPPLDEYRENPLDRLPRQSLADLVARHPDDQVSRALAGLLR